MLGHRLRRWPNIEPALFQRLVSAVSASGLMLCKFNISNFTLNQVKLASLQLDNQYRTANTIHQVNAG